MQDLILIIVKRMSVKLGQHMGGKGLIECPYQSRSQNCPCIMMFSIVEKSEAALMLGHVPAISPHYFNWMWLLIHALIPMLVQPIC